MIINTFVEGLYWVFDIGIMIFFLQKYLERKDIENVEIFMWMIPIIIAVFMKATEPLIGKGTIAPLIVSAILFTILCSLIFKSPIHQILILEVVVLVILGIVDILAISLMIPILNISEKVVWENPLGLFFPMVLMKASTLIVVKYIHSIKVELRMINKKVMYQVTLLLGMGVVLVYLGLEFYKSTTLSKMYVSILLVIMATIIMFFSAFIIGMTKKIIKHIEKEGEWIVENHGYHKRIKHIEDTEHLFTKIEAQRHLYKSQLQHLGELLKEKNADAANEYFENLNISIEKLDSIIETENSFLSSMLNVKHQIAKIKEIQINYDVGILTINDEAFIDVAIIIGDLLDNAIEACENLPVEERIVEIEVYKKGSDLNIVSFYINRNEQCYEFSKDLNSKDDGIRSIDHVVKKYNGFLKKEDKEKSFRLQITLTNVS